MFTPSEVMNPCLNETNLTLGTRIQGKVRDVYLCDNTVALVSTDWLSAFDRRIALIPWKGQVLNQISAWWFEQTAALVPNHFLAMPDPNVMVVRKCEVFPIEVVVRGYMTGTTSTSIWTQYAKGERNYCGIQLPEGMKKNQPFATPLLTPTTKDKIHDRPISPTEIVKDGWMSQSDWDEVSQLALKLYQFGVEKAKQHGLILVDTKYEFGRDSEGKIRVVDEIHTPDSSRYWLADSYNERFEQGSEPQNIDKEIVRLWYANNCDPYNDKELPPAPPELVMELSKRYIELYEKITNKKFVIPDATQSIGQRIQDNLTSYFEKENYVRHSRAVSAETSCC